MKWLILLAVVMALVFVIGMRVGASKQGGAVAFTPVGELPGTVQEDIERALSIDDRAAAVRRYRDATGAGAAAAQAAVETYVRRRSG